MTSRKFTESDVEDATLIWLEGMGYTVGHAPDIAPNEPQSERDSYDDVVLVGRLRRALSAINTHIPSSVRGSLIDDVIKDVLNLDAIDFVRANRQFHRWLVDGVDVDYRDGSRTVYSKRSTARSGGF